MGLYDFVYRRHIGIVLGLYRVNNGLAEGYIGCETERFLVAPKLMENYIPGKWRTKRNLAL